MVPVKVVGPEKLELPENELLPTQVLFRANPGRPLRDGSDTPIILTVGVMVGE
jgi:hypothetical protein